MFYLLLVINLAVIIFQIKIIHEIFVIMLCSKLYNQENFCNNIEYNAEADSHSTIMFTIICIEIIQINSQNNINFYEQITSTINFVLRIERLYVLLFEFWKK